MLFSGSYDHTLDVKQRLTIPAKARTALADGVTIVRASEGCLQLWPTADYKTAASRQMEGVSPFSPRGKKMQRILFGLSLDTELDKAGRLGLPAKMTAHAGLQKDATLIGSGQYLEVWEPTRLAEDELIAESDDLFSDGHPA